MEDQKNIRRLAAIFSADVKDYTKLMQDDEAATVVTITSYRDLMSALIQQHHGRVVDSPGDNLLAEFSSVVDAVQGAVSIQKEIKGRNDLLPNHRKMKFRIGINLGDVIVKENRIYGDGVNVAARLETLADAGGICISRTAYDQIEDKLPFGYEYIGEQTAKNLKKPLTAYKVNIWPEGNMQKPTAFKLYKKGQEYLNKSLSFAKQKTTDSQQLKTNKIIRKQRRFKFHLKAYLGVIGFLAIINILTYHGSIWFHWPALGWGIVIYLHWLKNSYSNTSVK